MSLRVFVVDDTIVYRSIVSDALRLIPDVEVIGSAASGRAALARFEELRPDLITLDIEMPGMNGLEVLDEIRTRGVDAGVIMISSLTVSGSGITIQALEKGAFDFITKPAESTTEKNRQAVLEALTPRVKAFARRRQISSILRGQSAAPQVFTLSSKPLHAQENRLSVDTAPRVLRGGRPEMVLLGISTGGPAALAQLLPALPPDFCLPTLIVQHMPPLFTQALAGSLSAKCAIKVKEAATGDVLQPGYAYIAPGGKHMKVTTGPNPGQKSLIITEDAPENNCRPSVDYLFRSAAHAFPGRALALILTGMGSDGTLGLRLLKRHGCHVLGQDEASCVVYGMPKAAFDAGVVDEVLPLSRIASRMVELTRRGLT